MTTADRFERTALRIKLYTCHTLVRYGRGGARIPESYADESKPGLVQMWPKYLTSELAASKPTLSLPDVAAMLEHRKTPKYNSIKRRSLTDSEVAVIQAWYDAAKRKEVDTIGQELSTVMTNIMAQASTHRDENLNLHEATQEQVAALEERMSAKVGLLAPNAALRGVVNRYAFVYAEFGNFYEDPSGSVVRSGRTMRQEGQEKRCRLVWVVQQVTSEPHLYYCEDEAGLPEKRSWSDFHHFSKNIQVKMKEACKPALPKCLRVLQGLKGCIIQEDGEDLLIEMAHYKPDQPARKSQNSIEKKRYKIKKAHVKFLRPDDDMEDNPGDGRVDDDNLEVADNASCSTLTQKIVRLRIRSKSNQDAGPPAKRTRTMATEYADDEPASSSGDVAKAGAKTKATGKGKEWAKAIIGSLWPEVPEIRELGPDDDLVLPNSSEWGALKHVLLAVAKVTKYKRCLKFDEVYNGRLKSIANAKDRFMSDFEAFHRRDMDSLCTNIVATYPHMRSGWADYMTAITSNKPTVADMGVAAVCIDRETLNDVYARHSASLKELGDILKAASETADPKESCQTYDVSAIDGVRFLCEPSSTVGADSGRLAFYKAIAKQICVKVC